MKANDPRYVLVHGARVRSHSAIKGRSYRLRLYINWRAPVAFVILLVHLNMKGVSICVAGGYGAGTVSCGLCFGVVESGVVAVSGVVSVTGIVVLSNYVYKSCRSCEQCYGCH